jgi:endonuclease/exonuclease/phosphatase (EEP) superfamily protein YafD
MAHFNVFVRNRAYGPTLEWIRQAKPDVVALVEFTEGWRRAMRQVKAEFPYRVEEPDTEGGGVAVYSRYPFRDSAHWRIGDMPKSLVRVKVAVGDGEVTLIAAHPWPPTTPARTREQGVYLRYVQSLMGEVKGPLIVAGDLNTTPWSHTFTDFVEGGHLTAARALPTWPANFGFLGIPIDHVLGRSVNIETINAGPRLGSDHLPLLADISF